jgi:uncharacterized iron-regulated membrane protein
MRAASDEASSVTDNDAASAVDATQRPPAGRRARTTLLQIHRLIGLTAGAVFVLIGLSGALLAYREAIDEALNASIMRVEPPAKDAAFRPVADIVAAALAAMPPEGRIERLTLPRHAGAAAAVTYLRETDDLDTYVYEMFVDPYRAKVTGERLFLHADDPLSQPFIPIVMTFHWTLLLGVNNAYVVGALGLLLFVSALVGLFLWASFNGDWRMGMTVKWGASPERVVFDLHRCVGVFSAAFLLVTLFTGVAMIFKPATRHMVNLLSPVRPDPDFGKSTPIPGRAPIGAGEAAAIADRVFPDGTLRWILFPSAPTSVYVVGKQADREPNQSRTTRNVGVEQYSGAIVGVQDRAGFTAGETFLEWLFPIHSGEAFGGLGRPIALVLGVTPLALFATGLIRWLRKRRARRRR